MKVPFNTAPPSNRAMRYIIQIADAGTPLLLQNLKKKFNYKSEFYLVEINFFLDIKHFTQKIENLNIQCVS